MGNDLNHDHNQDSFQDPRDPQDQMSQVTAFSRALRAPFLIVDRVFDWGFPAWWNPLRQLGTLTFFLFWICAFSGVYVFIFFETTVSGAFHSIEAMTNQGWYHAGVMRSLHRYSSDAMVVTGVLHMAREYAFGRLKGARWFAWFTGIPLIWFLFFSGVSGYWLVWDQLAQYVAVASMEWLDWLSIFGEPIANNFLTRGSLSDRFFSLLVFIHIFVPIILLFLMWMHVIRLSQPKINPPRGLALTSLLMLLALSFAKPAISQGEADLGRVPEMIGLDWFYLPLYPVFDAFGAGPTWALAVGVSLLLLSLPWLPPLRRAAPPVVTLEKCNGCGRCVTDCPYAALALGPRSDGGPFEAEAVVNADLCTRCGICVGACPPSTPFRHDDKMLTGIDLPSLPLRTLKEMAMQAGKAADGATATAPHLVVVGCTHGVAAKEIKANDGVSLMTLPCTGMLPPPFIDFLLSRTDAAGVMLTGCREGNCYHRLGADWTEERLLRVRDPALRRRVSPDRVRVFWADGTDAAAFNHAVHTFQGELSALDDKTGGDA